MCFSKHIFLTKFIFFKNNSWYFKWYFFVAMLSKSYHLEFPHHLRLSWISYHHDCQPSSIHVKWCQIWSPWALTDSYLVNYFIKKIYLHFTNSLAWKLLFVLFNIFLLTRSLTYFAVHEILLDDLFLIPTSNVFFSFRTLIHW